MTAAVILLVVWFSGAILLGVAGGTIRELRGDDRAPCRHDQPTASCPFCHLEREARQ